MQTHYIPKWVLRNFRPSKPYELNIHTGRIDDRGLKKAASGADLWAEDIEHELMTPHDTKAAEIYRRRIDGKGRILLTDSEMLDFATWAVLFILRVPNAERDITSMIDTESKDPQLAKQILLEHRQDILDKIKADSPEIYRQITELLGEVEGNAWIFDAFSTRILSNPSVFLLDPKTRWHEQIRMANFDKFASILCSYEWNWLNSTHGFIIGDNPLVRWNERLGRWNMGIATPGVEITLPLAHNLCLQIVGKSNNRSIRNVGQVMPCKRQQARIYNRRQRIAAISFVYAGERKLLDPWKSLWWPETKPIKKIG